MSVRDDPVLFLRGGKGGSAFGTTAGGNATTTAVTHRLDGPEHAAADDTTRLDATVDEHGLMPKLSGDASDVEQGDGTWGSRLSNLRAISPAQLVANTDNWNPTDLATADVIRVSTDASRNLTGITAPAAARELLLVNAGAFDLVLKDDVTSTAANRFYLPYGDVTLGADAGATLVYDMTAARWRIVAVTTAAGSTSFGTPAVTYGTPAAGAASTAIRTDAVLPPPNKVVLTLTNKVGSSVARGDVVKVNTGTDESFNSTTTGQAELSIGIVQETIADNAAGRVLVAGYADLVNVPASVTRGHFVETHTVAKQAVGNSTRRAGSFGQFLTGGTTPTALIWGQSDQTASGGSALTVEEVDGSPTDAAVTKIVFPNGTLGIASHVATYTPTGGSAQAHNENDADVLANATSTGDAGSRADHFPGTSLDVAWVSEATAISSGPTVKYSAVGMRMTANAAHHRLRAYTPSGAFRIETRLRYYLTSGQGGMGVLVRDSSTGDSTGNGFLAWMNNVGRFEAYSLDSGTYTQRGTTLVETIGLAGPWVYVAIERDGSNNWRADISLDRALWIPTVTGHSKTFTVAKVGYRLFGGIGATLGSVDFFDVVS